MASNVINTRADLDAMIGTPDHDAFMAVLAGSLWRLEKDDTTGVWRAVEDDATVERFGFTRADFPGAAPPVLPAYVAPPAWSPNPILNRVRAAREVALDRLMGIAGRSHRAGDLATAQACDDLAVALLNMTSTPAVMTAASDDELSLALLTAYAQIQAATPPNIEGAFAGFNL